MKNFAKLALFFSLSFIIIFLAATAARYLFLWVEWARNLPQKPETLLTIIIPAAHWALSLAMYASILLTLSYAARKHYFTPMIMICTMILSACFTFLISFALYYWSSVPPSQSYGLQTSDLKMGENGLILSNTINRNETAVILLRGTSEPLGPRVTAIPDRPLAYQESTANTNFSLPPVPFEGGSPWPIISLSIDIRLSGEQLQKRFNEGYFSFFLYSGALIFFLCSLSFLVRLSVWPLANLFIGILAFRGILAAEMFLNSPEIHEIFNSLTKNILPSMMAVPVIFIGFAILVNIYSILVFAAGRRNEDGY